MDRRSFLKRWGIGLAGLVVAGGAVRLFAYDALQDSYHWVGRQLDSDYEVKRAVAGLNSHYSYLNFDDQVAEEYVREFFERYTRDWEGHRYVFHVRFLLSTDFFPAADEAKPLSYVGFYDPLVWCSNPFAKPVEA